MNIRDGKLCWLIVGLISIALLVYVLFRSCDVIIYGIFIYYVARPVYRGFVKRCKYESVDAFCSLFFIVLPLVLICSYILSIAYMELSKFFVDSGFGYMGYVHEIVKNFKEIVSSIHLADISILFTQGDKWSVYITQLSAFSGSMAPYFDFPLKLFLTFVIAYYLLKDGAKLMAWITDTFLGGKTELAKKFFDDVDSALYQVYFGNILTAILTALVAIVIFYLLNLVAPPQLLIPYPLLFGILCGIGIFIPIVGVKLIWVPLTIYLGVQAYLNAILHTSWWFILLFIVVVSVVVDLVPEYALRPYISKKHVHVGALLLAYIFGVTIFGFLGLFLGPMILIIATSFMKIVLPELKG
ncbi:putative PurR-regulated permease PerM [Methanophagales archaeon]|nr:putative PurR-regulated permease PerM [Methanophagales archaeon]